MLKPRQGRRKDSRWALARTRQAPGARVPRTSRPGRTSCALGSGNGCQPGAPLPTPSAAHRGALNLSRPHPRRAGHNPRPRCRRGAPRREVPRSSPRKRSHRAWAARTPRPRWPRWRAPAGRRRAWGGSLMASSNSFSAGSPIAVEDTNAPPHGPLPSGRRCSRYEPRDDVRERSTSRYRSSTAISPQGSRSRAPLPSACMSHPPSA